jgi:hypothetical protein
MTDWVRRREFPAEQLVVDTFDRIDTGRGAARDVADAVSIGAWTINLATVEQIVISDDRARHQLVAELFESTAVNHEAPAVLHDSAARALRRALWKRCATGPRLIH